MRSWASAPRWIATGGLARLVVPYTEEIEEIDDLVQPVVIAAFEGWNDAADAASSVIDALPDERRARLAELASGEFA